MLWHCVVLVGLILASTNQSSSIGGNNSYNSTSVEVSRSPAEAELASLLPIEDRETSTEATNEEQDGESLDDDDQAEILAGSRARKMPLAPVE